MGLGRKAMEARRMNPARPDRMSNAGFLAGVGISLISILAGIPRASAGDDSGANRTRQEPNASARSRSIDRSIEEAWKKASVTPSKVASDEEFLRRAYLDLLGR